ncbi:MAG TPA: HXXEE domain-containing protein [Candidatus Paceibacterota bacterium]
MVTPRLKMLFALSVPLFIAHGIEELLTSFYAIDSHVAFVFGRLQPLLSLQTSFLILQLVFWTFLVIAYFVLRADRFILPLLLFVGVLYVYELHHLLKTFQAGSYYPGLATAIPLYMIGVLYWWELLGSRLKWRTAGKNI